MRVRASVPVQWENCGFDSVLPSILYSVLYTLYHEEKSESRVISLGSWSSRRLETALKEQAASRDTERKTEDLEMVGLSPMGRKAFKRYQMMLYQMLIF